MKEIVEAINHNTEWLYFKIFENKIFFIDLWSIIHFVTGMLLILLIDRLFSKNKWILLLFFLFSYEVVEISIRYVALNIFLPETIKDQFTDLIVGTLGSTIFYNLLLFTYRRKIQNSNSMLVEYQIIFFGSFSIAFIWVGFYDYKYNQEIFNSPGINYTALLLWWSGLCVFGKIYLYLKSIISKAYLSVVLSWGVYFFCLCLLEFFFYHILQVHEVGASEHKPMLFDIVHGTKTLHIFYLTVPLISILLTECVIKLVNSIMIVKKINETDSINTDIPQELQPE